MKKLYGIWFKGSLRGSWWQDADGSIFCSEYPQEMAAKKQNSFPEQDSDIREILLDGRPGDKPVEEDWRGHIMCLPDPASFAPPEYGMWNGSGWMLNPREGFIHHSPHKGTVLATIALLGLFDIECRQIGFDGLPVPEVTVLP